MVYHADIKLASPIFKELKQIIKDVSKGKRKIEFNDNSIFIHETEDNLNWLEITKNSLEVGKVLPGHSNEEKEESVNGKKISKILLDSGKDFFKRKQEGPSINNLKKVLGD